MREFHTEKQQVPKQPGRKAQEKQQGWAIWDLRGRDIPPLRACGWGGGRKMAWEGKKNPKSRP